MKKVKRKNIIQISKGITPLQRGLSCSTKRFYSSSMSFTEKIVIFYQNLLHRGIKLFIAKDKKPMYPEHDSRGWILTPKEVSYNIEKGNQIRIDLKSTEDIMVLDFDIYKWNIEDIKQAEIKKKLVNFLIMSGAVVVQSPRGGVHAYYLQPEDNKIKSHQNTSTKSLIPNVDFLGTSSGVCGPDSTRRFLSTNLTEFKKIPEILKPAFRNKKSREQEKIFDKVLPANWPKCWHEGFRRRTAIALFKLFNLTKEQLVEVNENFFFPPKAEKEFQAEVLDRTEKFIPFEEGFQGNTNLALHDEDLELVVFNLDDQQLYFYEENSRVWKVVDVYLFLQNVGVNPLSVNFKEKVLIEFLKLRRSVSLKEASKSYLEKEQFTEVLNLADVVVVKTAKDSEWIPLPSKKYSEIKLAYLKSQIRLSYEAYLENIRNFEQLEFDEVVSELMTKIPKTVGFLSRILQCKSTELKKSLTKVIICLAFLIHLKTEELIGELNLQKIIVVAGAGGTGKSALSSFLTCFCKDENIAIADLTNLNNRFEKSGLQNKYLVLFNEVVYKEQEQLRPQDLASIFTLTGSELQRVEQKYGEIFKFQLDAIIIVSSNFLLQTKSVANYGALKRRLLKIILDSYIKPYEKVRTKDLLDLLESEICLIKEFAVKLLQKKNLIINFVENYDSENLVLKYKEYSWFERWVDPYFAFLTEGFRERKKTDQLLSPLTFEQVWALFLSYLYTNKGSSYSIPDFDEYCKWRNNEIIKPVPGENPLIGKSDLPFVNKEKDTLDFGSKLKNVLVSRGRHIPKLPELKHSKVFFKNLVTQKVSYMNTITNWVLNEEYLSANPYFLQEIKSMDFCWNYTLKGLHLGLFVKIYSKISVIKAEKTTKVLKKDVKLLKKDMKDIKLNKIKILEDKILKLEQMEKTGRSEAQKKDLNKFRSNLRYYKKVQNRRSFSTFVRVNKTNKQELEEAKRTLVKLLTNFAVSRPDKELLYWKSFVDKLTLTSCPKFSDKKDKEFYLEQGIVKDINTRSLLSKEQLTFLDKLHNTFGLSLGDFIFEEIINCLFYQRCFFNQQDVQNNKLVLHPLINHLWKKLHEKHEINGTRIKLIKDKEFEIEKVIKEKEIYKENKKTISQKDYKDKLIFYKNKLSSLRRVLKKIKNESETYIVKENIENLFGIFEEMKMKIAVHRGTDKKLHRTIHFLDWTEIELINTIQKIKVHPMIIQPLDWKINTNSREVYGGGYLINKEFKTRLLMGTKSFVKSKVLWNESYIKNLNLIQRIPQTFCIKGLTAFLQKELDLLFFNLQYHLERLEKINYGDKQLRYQYFISRDEINSLKSKLLNWILTINDFYLLIDLDKSVDSTFELYYPIHLDSSLRIYNSGNLNPIGNKILRIFSTKPDSQKDFKSKEEEDLIKRFYITIQKEKISNLTKVLSKEEILRNDNKEKWIYKDKNKFEHFSWLYKNDVDFNITVDATSSVLQIYSLLFGDLELAKWSNLLGGDYTDAYLEISKKIKIPTENWNRKMKDLLTNRKFLKQEITFYFYGSVQSEGIKRALTLEPTLTILEAKEVVIEVRKFIEMRFEKGFRFKNLIKTLHKKVIIEKNKPLSWNLQGNICSYKITKIKKTRVRVNSSIFKGKENQVSVERVTKDWWFLKEERRILTTIIHSCDAELITNLKVILFKKYGVNIFTIHDAINLWPGVYKIACKEYKTLLTSLIFEKKLSDFFLEEEIPESIKEELHILEQEIQQAKEVCDWKDLKSDTGFPLYPES